MNGQLLDRPSHINKRRGSLVFHPWLISLALLALLSGCISGPKPATLVGTPSPLNFTYAGSPTQAPTLAASLASSATSTLPPLPTTAATPTPTLILVPSPQPAVVFAAIGDYGSRLPKEGEVADLVKSWNPDFIITLGDNNYQEGAWDTIDASIGQYYHDYIYPYTGTYGEGADVNRFFPIMGDHDTKTDNGQPFLDYFTLPGNELYYDYVWGPLHLYALNNVNDSEGFSLSSTQANWLKQGLSASTSPWNIVYMHFPPYSSGTHGSVNLAQWPYKVWGADLVLAGNDHSYERLEVDGLTYAVNGLGGVGMYDFQAPLAGSKVRYNADLGAMRFEATDQSLKFEFITRSGEVIDTYEIKK